MKPFIVVCIPAYNEEKRISAVIEGARRHADQVIVCDDGSGDETSIVSKSVGAEVVRHNTNEGYGAAIQTLFKAALESGTEIIVTIDADSQHDPEDIPRLIGCLVDHDLDIVVGSRFLGNGVKQIPGWRKLGIEVINKLSISGLTDTQSGFRAYKRDALLLLDLKDTGMSISTEILHRAIRKGLIIGEVPIVVTYHKDSSTHNPLLHGLSVAYNTLKLVVDRTP